jgi:DHA2 family multidrug resistance protein
LQNSLGWTAIQAGSVFLPVGVIQGIVAPLAGRLVTKINAKIVLLTGIVCIVSSFVLGYFLSYQTEHNAIMVMLYLRGLGMGILFAPLSTIALSKIPRDQMAQASSLFNVTRQLGGSFGVAILSSLLTTRTIFHQQIYGEQLNANSPELFTSLSRWSQHLVHSAGSSMSQSLQQGKMLLIKHTMSQGYIQGIADDFLIAAVITTLGVIPVLALQTRKKKVKEVPEPSADSLNTAIYKNKKH